MSFNSSSVGEFFLELNCKGLYLCLRRDLQNRCHVFTFSTKREFRQFHVEVAQRRQRNVQRRVIHVQSCCFANKDQLLFDVLVAVIVVVA